MGLDLTKLEKVKHRGQHIIARCPACAEEGADRKGEHLSIDERGQFCCVLYPGAVGEKHRQRIFELIGTREIKGMDFELRPAPSPEPKVIQKDILGHLGHIKSTHAQKNLKTYKNEDSIKEDFNRSVPNVPDSIFDL